MVSSSTVYRSLYFNYDGMGKKIQINLLIISDWVASQHRRVPHNWIMGDPVGIAQKLLLLLLLLLLRTEVQEVWEIECLCGCWRCNPGGGGRAAADEGLWNVGLCESFNVGG